MEMSNQLLAAVHSATEKGPMPPGQKVGWDPEPIQILRRREKCLPPIKHQFLNCPARILVTILIELSWFPNAYSMLLNVILHPQ
jgi:hypothetical protein